MSRPFDTTEGTPTLTFVTGSESLALPYHFLLRLQLVKGAAAIQLAYEDMNVTIEGNNLHSLWRELQLFNVREIRACEGSAAKALAGAGEAAPCSITAVRIERGNDADDP